MLHTLKKEARNVSPEVREACKNMTFMDKLKFFMKSFKDGINKGSEIHERGEKLDLKSDEVTNFRVETLEKSLTENARKDM